MIFLTYIKFRQIDQCRKINFHFLVLMSEFTILAFTCTNTPNFVEKYIKILVQMSPFLQIVKFRNGDSSRFCLKGVIWTS